MKITFIGAGNIGLAMASYIPEEHEVVIHSSRPNDFKDAVTYIDKVTGETSSRKIDFVTNSYELATRDATYIFITHPSFMIEDTLENIAPFIKDNVKIGIVPGTGGVEFFAKKVLEKGAILFGLDRVPCVSRLKEYGQSVVASKKVKTRLATLPNTYSTEVSQAVSELLGMEIEQLDNFLTVTFTPSNPIVHTARLYSMLHDYEEGVTSWSKNIPFYGEWDDLASKYLLGCDEELQNICNSLTQLNMKGVIPLTEHYGVSTVSELTSKIQSIDTMKHILSPMVMKCNHFDIDKSSRYFLEDFPYGLCILKGFAIITKTDTPYIDKILKWYEKFGNVEYFVKEQFIGKSLKNSTIPQNFGLTTIEDINIFYQQ